MINKDYSQQDYLQEIRKYFLSTKVNNCRLDYFFDDKTYREIVSLARKTKFKHEKKPDKYSYSLADNRKLEKIFKSETLRAFIEKIIHKKVRKIDLLIREFSHRDYTLLHDENAMDNSLEFFFFLSPQWEVEYGGNLVLVDEDTFVFTPKSNSFILIDKKKTSKEFIQYINHLSNGKRLLLVSGKIHT